MAILNDALRSDRRPVALAVIETLGRCSDAAAHARLATVVAVGDGELAAAAARALGESGDPQCEGALIRAVQDERHAARLAAVDALGLVGSAAAIGPLRHLVDAREVDLRRAVRQAIAAIQSRLPGASPGQLSIAAGEEGQLSMAGDEPGRVSFADGKDGGGGAEA